MAKKRRNDQKKNSSKTEKNVTPSTEKAVALFDTSRSYALQHPKRGNAMEPEHSKIAMMLEQPNLHLQPGMKLGYGQNMKMTMTVEQSASKKGEPPLVMTVEQATPNPGNKPSPKITWLVEQANDKTGNTAGMTSPRIRMSMDQPTQRVDMSMQVSYQKSGKPSPIPILSRQSSNFSNTQNVVTPHIEEIPSSRSVRINSLGQSLDSVKLPKPSSNASKLPKPKKPASRALPFTQESSTMQMPKPKKTVLPPISKQSKTKQICKHEKRTNLEKTRPSIPKQYNMKTPFSRY